ncbi:MAG: hypothetical protein ACP5UN_03325 [Candidatus Micrarchaeia archaeon]
MFGKNVLKGREHAQSAMEYLMTYGWAILIIAIVLAILFKLGVFSGASLTGTSCIGTVGWSCSGLSYGTSGLSFTLGQSTGTQVNNVVVACSSTAGTGGYPASGNFYYPTAPATNSGLGATSSNIVTATSNSLAGAIPNGGTITISNIICGGMGAPAIGQTFQGYAWVAYITPTSTSPQVVQALTISAKETS